MEELLCDMFGKDIMSGFKSKHEDKYLEIMANFEKSKQNFMKSSRALKKLKKGGMADIKRQYMSIQMPCEFGEYVEELHDTDLSLSLRSSQLSISQDQQFITRRASSRKSFQRSDSRASSNNNDNRANEGDDMVEFIVSEFVYKKIPGYVCACLMLCVCDYVCVRDCVHISRVCLW